MYNVKMVYFEIKGSNPFHNPVSAHQWQTRRSVRNYCPISTKVTLFRLQSENKVALFIFAGHSFLAYNHCFKVNLIQSFSD